MHARNLIIFFAVHLVCLCNCTIVCAYDVHEAHPKITERAVNRSQIQNYLMNNVGLENGKDQKLKGDYMKAPEFFGEYTSFSGKKTILDWIKTGSSNEDSPACRAKAHFHNPIHPGDWRESQLTDSIEVDLVCGSDKYSNVTWATGFISPNGPSITRDGQYLGWDNARQFYYIALSLENPEKRDFYLAETFRTLGHVMHMLQDASVPAHVRNDMKAHLWSPSVLIKNPFERYVSRNTSAIYGLTISPTLSAPLRLTDLWDADVYTGDNPSAGTDQGLAEYSNANFVSDYTIFRPVSNSEHYFKYPNRNTSVQKVDYAINDPVHPGKLISRKYYKKIADGETNGDAGYRLAGVGYLVVRFPLWQWWKLPLILPPMDDYVHDDYAQLILPRAVGYSTTLLDYFFRGTLEISPPKQHVYALIDGSQSQEFTELKAKVRNITPNEKFKGGTIRAIARYKVIEAYAGDLSAYPPNGSTMQGRPYEYSVSAPITLTPDPITGYTLDNDDDYTFDFSGKPIPAGITDLTLQVVAKGTLGNETDIAVAVGMRDLSEPTHQVIWNLTDMFGLDYNIYTEKVIMDTKELREKVDLNDNGKSSEPGEPYIKPHEITFEISFARDANLLTDAPLVAGGPLQAGNHFRLIGIFDLSRPNYIELGWYDFESSDVSVKLIQPAVTQSAGTSWQATPAISFRNWLDGATKRPFIQHDKVGILRCMPVSFYGDSPYCAYPEENSIPANKVPSNAELYE